MCTKKPIRMKSGVFFFQCRLLQQKYVLGLPENVFASNDLQLVLGTSYTDVNSIIVACSFKKMNKISSLDSGGI